MGLFGLFGGRKKQGEWRQFASLGVTMYKAGRFDEAIGLFDQAIESGGDIPEVLFQRGMAYYRLGQLSDATRDFYDVILAGPPARLQRDTWYNLGKANAELENLQEAIGCYENAIGIDPTFAQAYCNLGGVRARLGEKNSDLEQYEQALRDLDQGLVLDPRDALAYYNRATVKSALQNDDGIDADLQRFLELAPSDHPYVPEVTRRLAAVGPLPAHKLEMGRERQQKYLWQKISEANDNHRFAEAIEHCEKFLQMNARSGDVWDEKAFALMCQGRTEEALACCDEGVALNPDVARLHNTRGLLLLTLKRYREALGAFEKYVAMAPPEYADVVARAKAHIQELRKSINQSSTPQDQR